MKHHIEVKADYWEVPRIGTFYFALTPLAGFPISDLATDADVRRSGGRSRLPVR